jgi:tetratricopeptide (TPR) repeat protein
MRPVQQLIALFSSGDFQSAESERLIQAMSPFSLLLCAVARISRGERAEAWRDVRRATETAPRNRLVRVLASRLWYLLGDYRAALTAAKAAADLGVASAALVRFEQARELGWYREACETIEEWLRNASTHRAAGHAALVDRALRNLLNLYVESDDDEAAAAILTRYLSFVRDSAALCLLAARVYERRAERDNALSAIHRALEVQTPAVSTRVDAARLLLELGAFDEARAMYAGLLDDDATAPHALEALGRLCLWIGDAEGALAYAERLRTMDERNTAGWRMRAAVTVLRGEYPEAMPILDAVLRDNPHDGEAYLWRAEAALRLGRLEDAKADVDRSLYYGRSFPAPAIRLLAECGRGPVALALWEDLEGELAAMRADPSGILVKHDPSAPVVFGDQLTPILERALAAMRGNRTPLGTYVNDDGRLARLPRSTLARVASRQALELIRVASPEDTFRRFDDVITRFPDSPMPLVHRGELQLWLGRYAEARADLEAAIAIRRQTRWAWYGLSYLDLIAGDPERALATCATGIEVMDNTEGPVALSCRGEAYRLLGRLDEAREQLLRSCEINPTRLSSWINLALVHGASGDRPAQRQIFRRLASAAPGLVSEAAFELGDEVFTQIVLSGPFPPGDADAGDGGAMIERVLQQCLTMMRGNRSSSCVTYFTMNGQMRYVLQDSRGKVFSAGSEDRTLGWVRDLLTRAIDGRSAEQRTGRRTTVDAIPTSAARLNAPNSF